MSSQRVGTWQSGFPSAQLDLSLQQAPCWSRRGPPCAWTIATFQRSLSQEFRLRVLIHLVELQLFASPRLLSFLLELVHPLNVDLPRR